MARARWKATENLIEKAREILERDNPMTLRQLHYRLVSVLVTKNIDPDYKRLSRVMTKARREGLILYEWIVDRTKVEITPNVWVDPVHYSETVARAYRRDYWRDQPYHVEIWCEKDTINGAVEPVYSRYGVTFRAYHGFNSTTKKNEIAGFFKSLGKPVMILYLGDYDPSRWDIQRDLKASLNKYDFFNFNIIRLAIMPKDIRDFDLPLLRVKDKDSRAPKFKRRFGNNAVELDALPPDELRSRIENAICALIDWEKWERAEQVEKVEIQSIREIAGKFKDLVINF